MKNTNGNRKAEKAAEILKDKIGIEVDLARSPLPFLVYDPKRDILYEVENAYGLDLPLAIAIVQMGLKRNERLEYIGEL